ncbi:hypothetical protein GCM10010129_80600 [Streptomyces fumigatiscleroticus]|nr:hypothetical protein GCM10010129_80600 [Streptomyces fumigatiscleroticus]
MSRHEATTRAGRRLQVGDQITFASRTWQVTGLIDGRVRLAADDGTTGCMLASRLVAAEDFAVTGTAAPTLPPAAVWAALPLAARERALAWQRHIREIETGQPGGPGSDGTPRPEYDPQLHTLAERDAAKARELTALGWPKASRATVQRMRLAYHRHGLLGLVDKRSLRTPSPTGRTDPRVVTAVLEALRRCRGRRTATVRQVIDLAEQIVAQTYGPDRVPLPARASLYRLVRALEDPAEPLGSPARTATRPARTATGEEAGGWPAALRPAERVQVAAARLGIQVVGEDGRPVAVAVTAALDAATGCVLAAVLHPQQASPVDLAVLLAEMAVPPTVRPGWRELLTLAHQALPHRLMTLTARIEAAATRPAAVPETLVFVPAAATAGTWFLTCARASASACSRPPPDAPAGRAGPGTRCRHSPTASPGTPPP